MTNSIDQAESVTLTVKRPNGAVETITHPTLKSLTPAQFKQIQEGTAKAGRGEVLSYTNNTVKVKILDFKRNANTWKKGFARTVSATEKAMTLNSSTY